MSITLKEVSKFIEAIITVPHGVGCDRFDHNRDWSYVVFSNGVAAIECQTQFVSQYPDCAMVTVRLKQRDYDRLQVIIK
jgi:hypothetical protein